MEKDLIKIKKTLCCQKPPKLIENGNSRVKKPKKKLSKIDFFNRCSYDLNSDIKYTLLELNK